MSEPVYARAPDVVWRLAPDRVLVRRVHAADGAGAAVDLEGTAALVWVALDTPGTTADLAARIADAGLAADPPVTDAVMDLLVGEALVVRAAAEGGSGGG